MGREKLSTFRKLRKILEMFLRFAYYLVFFFFLFLFFFFLFFTCM